MIITSYVLLDNGVQNVEFNIIFKCGLQEMTTLNDVSMGVYSHKINVAF